jgi:ATP-dependent DNA ligase
MVFGRTGMPIPAVRPMRWITRDGKVASMGSREGETVFDVARDVVSLPDLPVSSVDPVVADRLPVGSRWLYEPDWDGLRVVAIRRGDAVGLDSDSGRPLARYFPEVVRALAATAPSEVALIGSLVVIRPEGFSFDLLRKRIHPSQTRVAHIARAWPSTLVLTDIASQGSLDVRLWPTRDRRAVLTQLAAQENIEVASSNLRRIAPGRPFEVTPQTFDAEIADRWLNDRDATGRDGVIARHIDGRSVVRVRRLRRAACVVTGVRTSAASGARSLLLAVYDGEDLVEVGRTAALKRAPVRREVMATVAAAVGAPAGADPSVEELGLLQPSLVCEVSYARLRANRFRSAASFVRWLPDVDPRRCSIEQLQIPGSRFA